MENRSSTVFAANRSSAAVFAAIDDPEAQAQSVGCKPQLQCAPMYTASSGRVHYVLLCVAILLLAGLATVVALYFATGLLGRTASSNPPPGSSPPSSSSVDAPSVPPQEGNSSVTSEGKNPSASTSSGNSSSPSLSPSSPSSDGGGSDSNSSGSSPSGPTTSDNISSSSPPSSGESPQPPEGDGSGNDSSSSGSEGDTSGNSSSSSDPGNSGSSGSSSSGQEGDEDTSSLPPSPAAPPPPPLPAAPSAGPSQQPLQQELNLTALTEQEEKYRYVVCIGDKSESENADGGFVVSVEAKPTGVEWKGWGTSLVWWARLLATFPQDRYDEVLDLIFDGEKGLGLNMVRYHIPASYNPNYSPKLVGDIFQSQGFKLNRDAAYNWSQDLGQRRVLVDAKRRGVEVFEAISYSPPWWMTISGDVTGSEDSGPNFKEDYADEFAEYLADVAEHFATDAAGNGSNEGVTFQSIAPFNEPLELWWGSNRTKEGCCFTTKGISKVVVALSKALYDRLLPAEIGVMDSWTTYTIKAFNSSTEALTEEAQAAVGRIDVHGYISSRVTSPGNDNVQYTKLRTIAQRVGKPVYQTEWGPLGYPGTDMEHAAMLGRVVAQHVNIAGVSGWFIWQAVLPKNDGWGFLFVPFYGKKANYSVTFTKQYWVFMQFTRWVRPGSQIIEVDSECQHGVVAAYDPNRGLLSVTIVNQEFVDRNVTLDATQFVRREASGRGASLVEVYRTSSSEDYKLIDSYKAQAPTTLFLISAALSVTTVVLHDVQM